MKTTFLTAFTALASFGGAAVLAEEVSFDVLADFEYTEGMTLPSTVTKYDMKTITVTGFMQREYDGEGEVESFLLVSDSCGCTGTPMMNEFILCVLPDGETTEVGTSLVTATGTVYVGEAKEDGIVYAIYTMDVDKLDK